MRRLLPTLFVAAACLALAQPVDAQFKFGVQGALITSVEAATALDTDGTSGLGARLMLDPPLFPLALVGSGVYYFPDCGAIDCSFWTASIAAQLRLPTPVVSPYIMGGWQIRRAEEDGASTETSGPLAGIGVQLNFALSLFIEATMEFNDEITAMPDLDTDPIVIKGGILIG